MLKFDSSRDNNEFDNSDLDVKTLKNGNKEGKDSKIKESLKKLITSQKFNKFFQDFKPVQNPEKDELNLKSYTFSKKFPIKTENIYSERVKANNAENLKGDFEKKDNFFQTLSLLNSNRIRKKYNETDYNCQVTSFDAFPNKNSSHRLISNDQQTNKNYKPKNDLSFLLRRGSLPCRNKFTKDKFLMEIQEIKNNLDSKLEQLNANEEFKQEEATFNSNIEYTENLIRLIKKKHPMLLSTSPSGVGEFQSLTISLKELSHSDSISNRSQLKILLSIFLSEAIRQISVYQFDIGEFIRILVFYYQKNSESYEEIQSLNYKHKLKINEKKNFEKLEFLERQLKYEKEKSEREIAYVNSINSAQEIKISEIEGSIRMREKENEIQSQLLSESKKQILKLREKLTEILIELEKKKDLEKQVKILQNQLDLHSDESIFSKSSNEDRIKENKPKRYFKNSNLHSYRVQFERKQKEIENRDNLSSQSSILREDNDKSFELMTKYCGGPSIDNKMQDGINNLIEEANIPSLNIISSSVSLQNNNSIGQDNPENDQNNLRNEPKISILLKAFEDDLVIYDKKYREISVQTENLNILHPNQNDLINLISSPDIQIYNETQFRNSGNVESNEGHNYENMNRGSSNNAQIISPRNKNRSRNTLFADPSRISIFKKDLNQKSIKLKIPFNRKSSMEMTQRLNSNGKKFSKNFNNHINPEISFSISQKSFEKSTKKIGFKREDSGQIFDSKDYFKVGFFQRIEELEESLVEMKRLFENLQCCWKEHHKLNSKKENKKISKLEPEINLIFKNYQTFIRLEKCSFIQNSIEENMNAQKIVEIDNQMYNKKVGIHNKMVVESIIKLLKTNIRTLNMPHSSIMVAKELFREVNSLYEEYIKHLKCGKIVHDMSLPCYYYNLLLLKNNNDRKACQKKLFIFLFNILKNLTHLKVNIFARLSGLVEDSMIFLSDEIKRFFEAYEYLTKVSKTGFTIPYKETDDKRLIPLVRAFEYMKIITENSGGREILTLRKEIEKFQEKDPYNFNKIGCIDLEIFISKVLIWHRFNIRRTKSHVIVAFTAADLDDNKKLSLIEFKILFRNIEPQKYQVALTEKIFNDCADLIEFEEKFISFDAFVDTSMKFGLFSEENQNTFIGTSDENNVKISVFNMKYNWEQVKKELELKLRSIKERGFSQEFEYWNENIFAFELNIQKIGTSSDYFFLKALFLIYKLMNVEMDNLYQFSAMSEEEGKN